MEKVHSAPGLRPGVQTRALARQAAALFLGAAGGCAQLYGLLCPFGLGLALGLSEDTFCAAAVGAALAALLRFSGARAVSALCALAAAVIVRWLCPRRFAPACACACGAQLLAAALLALPLGAAGTTGLWTAGADTLLAALIGYALRQSPPEKAGGGLLLLGAALAACLGGVRAGPLCVGVAASALALLWLCCRGDAKRALGAAAALGAALGAADSSLAAPAVGLCLAALLAVLCAPGDKYRCAAVFGAGALSGAFCLGASAAAVHYLLALALAGGAFLCVPQRYLLAQSDSAHATAEAAARPKLSGAATKLGAVAESLEDIAATVNGVYKALPRRGESYNWVVDATHDALCFNCGRREECWQKAYSNTTDGLFALKPVLEQQGRVGVEDLPGQLSRCIHPAALTSAVTRAYTQFRARQEARIHADALRTALTEQYGAVADALSALSAQLGEPGLPEAYKTGRVSELFSQLNMTPLECAVTQDNLGRLRAAVTLPRASFTADELHTLSQEVAHICRRAMDEPQKLSCKGLTTLIFTEKPVLRPVFGTAGVAAQGEISGDAVQQFCSPGAAQMILCDGMGTGRPAAVDGSLAAELTARLLKAGFGAETAARLVNVALALKSDDEGGATLDLISVDLFTGTAGVFKAGAAPGFVVHGGKARAVGDASLPVGILGAVNGQTHVLHLTAGDLAVLVSDGVLVDGPGWLLQQLELSAAANESAQSIAERLVRTARARAEHTGRPDDITAAVLRLVKC